jgi:hypothetical protein
MQIILSKSKDDFSFAVMFSNVSSACEFAENAGLLLGAHLAVHLLCPRPVRQSLD